MNIIKSEKISYTYPTYQEENAEGKAAEIKPALKDVSFDVEAGQFICILGRNGSGKSTLARHLNALLVPNEGTLWIDGMDSKDASKLWDIRGNVGMVFQNPDNQIIGSVVDEDVAFGLENIGVPSEEIQRRVAQSLENVGIAKYAKSSPNKLSGGQKQRVAVAGILAMNPKCIVLDESTAMLDPRGREEVMETVRKLNKEQGITVITITHYMDEALMADHIFVMIDGQIAMQGTPGEVFEREDILERAGLRLPQICQLAHELRKAGMDIPKGVLTADELKEAVVKAVKKNAD
ncbi:MAG: energy-coupling factor transporter ATPase [Lachnospiraceae bacterium]|nr:energy-coupling factor transporter ATPase [Lachnospiraceae bacterium]